jgi:hypothetical protein
LAKFGMIMTMTPVTATITSRNIFCKGRILWFEDTSVRENFREDIRQAPSEMKTSCAEVGEIAD